MAGVAVAGWGTAGPSSSYDERTFPPRGTIPPVTAPAPASRPPRRALLRVAGVLTQLLCAGCLLLGTIAFVLLQQNHLDGSTLVVLWAAAALIGLVFGGLMGRGGLISLVVCGVIDATFG